MHRCIDLIPPLERKLVSVAFTAFGRALPTFSFGFCEKWSASWQLGGHGLADLKVLLLLLLFLCARTHGRIC